MEIGKMGDWNYPLESKRDKGKAQSNKTISTHIFCVYSVPFKRIVDLKHFEFNAFYYISISTCSLALRKSVELNAK